MLRNQFQLASFSQEDARKECWHPWKADVYHAYGSAITTANGGIDCPRRYLNTTMPETNDRFLQVQPVDPAAAKLVYLEAMQALLRDRFQPTWGRVQQMEEMEYERLVEAVTFIKRLRSRLTELTGNVLEEFEGFVDQFDGEVAYVTLKTPSGETFYGQYPTAELMARGIRERRRFVCKTVEAGSQVTIDLEAIPDLEVSEDRERVIEEKLRELLGDENDNANAP